MLILHIGFSKTGTTAIQQFMSANRNKLAALRIIYPKAFCVDNSHHKLFWLTPPVVKIHNKFAMQTIQGENFEQHAFALKRELQTVNAETIVMSSELFSNTTDIAKIKQLKNKFSEFGFKIVIYLRRQDDYLKSMYNQVVKNNHYSGSLSDFLSERTQLIENLHYDRFIDKLENVVASNNITVRIYDTQTFVNHNIYDDFICCLPGAVHTELAKPDADKNPRLSYYGLALKHLLNSRIDEHKKLVALMKAVLDYDSQLAAIKLDPLPDPKVDEQLSQLMSGYQTSNQSLRSKRFPQQEELFSSDSGPANAALGFPSDRDIIRELPPQLAKQIVGIMLQ